MLVMLPCLTDCCNNLVLDSFNTDLHSERLIKSSKVDLFNKQNEVISVLYKYTGKQILNFPFVQTLCPTIFCALPMENWEEQINAKVFFVEGLVDLSN